MEKQNLTIPLAIIIAGALIAGGVYFSNKSDKISVEGENVPAKIEISPVTEKDHIVGNPDAKVMIVEYSDTECPYCKKFHATLNQIVDEYAKNGDVAWVYRHFPIDQLHSKARKEAEATECAADLGGETAFWTYINKLYETTPSNNGFDAAQLPTLAEEIGLDKAAFEECLSSGRMAEKVEAQYQDGRKAGAQGTPYSVLITKDEKYPVSGALPYANIKQVIDAILEQN